MWNASAAIWAAVGARPGPDAFHMENMPARQHLQPLKKKQHMRDDITQQKNSPGPARRPSKCCKYQTLSAPREEQMYST